MLQEQLVVVSAAILALRDAGEPVEVQLALEARELSSAKTGEMLHFVSLPRELGFGKCSCRRSTHLRLAKVDGHDIRHEFLRLCKKNDGNHSD